MTTIFTAGAQQLAYGARRTDNAYLTLSGNGYPVSEAAYLAEDGCTITAVSIFIARGNREKSFELSINGTVVETFDVPASGKYQTEDLDHDVSLGQEIRIRSLPGGGYAKGVTALLTLRGNG